MIRGLLISLLSLTGWLAAALPASASFMDDDFYCRTYGCVIVHDGNTFEVYDVYILGLIFGGQVRAGAPLIPWSGNPFRGSGDVETTVTGSLDTRQIASTEGLMLGIGQSNGNGNVTQITDDGDGYLDASDTLQAFEVSRRTQVVLTGTSYSDSFYIGSRNVRFSVRAMAVKDDASLDFAESIDLEDIGLRVRLTSRGSDDGMSFGDDATTAQSSVNNQVRNLGDLEGRFQTIAEFNRNSGIRRRNASQDSDQTVRVDLEYEMPEYDMSMGKGDLKVIVYFEFYRE